MDSLTVNANLKIFFFGVCVKKKKNKKKLEHTYIAFMRVWYVKHLCKLLSFCSIISMVQDDTIIY